jgi:hypothetical protein
MKERDMKAEMNRRTFLGGAAASTAAFTIVPRHVLGGAGKVAPSEKITFAYIGCGTQGLREMMGLLATPEVQIVTVCDPEKDGVNYVDWSRDGLRGEIARALGKPDWRKGGPIPGGRDVAKEIIELYYGKERPSGQFKGCTTHVDFRELLEKEKGIDAVKVMTPDHLHATVAIAAMKKGKHVMVHKPLANRLTEARLVVETARRTKVGTYFLPASAGEQVRTVAGWIREGAIGTLREIHNWSYRPVWPQYATIPTDRPPVPKDFDWDLWLGPSLPRPYHPHYTHAVFRGWYEFGGGSIADMGHYSLWPVFREFSLDNLAVVESTPSHVCTVENGVCSKIKNDFAFPFACTIRFKFPAKGGRAAVDLFWYDGSMRPPTPPEVEEDNKELESEGMMFVGDKGKILGGFRCENPRIIPERRARELGKGAATPESEERGRGRGRGRDAVWVKTFQGGAPTYGDFTLGGPISDAFTLGAISLRTGGKRLVWDGNKITNLPAANKYLTREYRKGWELTA